MSIIVKPSPQLLARCFWYTSVVAQVRLLGTSRLCQFPPQYAIWHCHCFCPTMPNIIPKYANKKSYIANSYYIVTLCMILCSPLKSYFVLVRNYYLKGENLFLKQLKRVAPTVPSWLLHPSLVVQSHYFSTTCKRLEGLLH